MSIRNGGKIIAGYGGSGGGNGDSLNNQNPTSPIRQVYDWIGTLEEYEAQQVAELHPTWVCFILDDTTPKDKNLYTNRNVGDIFFTTRLDLLLNGAVECDGNTYSFEDFTGEQSIGNLLKDGKIPYVSLSQYASLLTNNGVVGVFGWDGGNNVEFRVPTLENIFVEAGNTNNIGEFTAAGLPNIEGDLELGKTGEGVINKTGVFLNSTTANTTDSGHTGLTTPSRLKISFDASQSNQIYGNSNTVQPKSIKYRPMVQLSIGFTDEAVEKCMNVVNDVAELKEQQPHNLIDSMITNCITHIPQDIKLELNNGTLTLKAGSKVWFPDGFEQDGVTPKFNSLIVPEDVTTTGNHRGSGLALVLYRADSASCTICSVGTSYSGGTQPSPGTVYFASWYDTNNNIIKTAVPEYPPYDWYGQWGFPIGIVNIKSQTITGIDQVFNGFGYIGSTVFVLPGVKGLMPNGRNEDGTLKNTLITIEKVNAVTPTVLHNLDVAIILENNINKISYNGAYRYDENQNRTFDDSPSWLSERQSCYVGSCTLTDSVISNFKINTSFHAVDYNTVVDKDIDNISSSGISKIINMLTPDYSKPVSISSWPYNIPSAGWIRAEIHANNNEYGKRLLYTTPDGATIGFGSGALSSGNYSDSQSVMIIVEAGGKINRESTAISAVFYPMKGLSL